RPGDLLSNSYKGEDSTTLKKLFSARSSTLESLRRQLSGDLDRIVMLALRKEPEWRYQTAAQLRDDITLYLEGQPVSSPPNEPTPFAKPRAPLSQDNSLAVLPLKVIDGESGSPAAPDYLGTGLADALITRLSAIRSFAVRPT